MNNEKLFPTALRFFGIIAIMQNKNGEKGRMCL